jgi:hypothetical protein
VSSTAFTPLPFHLQRADRPQPGTALSQERLHPAEILDLAAYSDLVSIEEAAAYAAIHSGWTGSPQARDALVLADENAWSPPEVPMRLIWVLDAGFPRPVCNRPLFDRSGRHIGTPDIFDPESGTAGEFDGEPHLSRERRSHDLRREALFRGHGLEYFTVLGNELPERQMLVERMAGARARALWLPPERRTWTLTPPAWWTRATRWSTAGP